MKKCSVCGTQFDDSWLACPNCGGKPEPETVQSSYHYGGGYTGSTVNRERSKSTVEHGYSQNTDTFGQYVSYMNETELPWYLRTWCIIVGFILFWPIGIVLLIMRMAGNRGAKKSTTSAVSGVRRGIGIAGGIICLIIGITGISSAPGDMYDTQEFLMDILLGALFIIGGVMLIRPKSAAGKGKPKKWAKYEVLIDNRGNTKISFIANKLGISEEKAATEIQNMIHKGFLRDDRNGIGAYIDGRYNLVVMTQNGVPIVPVEETMARDIAAKKAKEEAEEQRRAEAAEKKRRENATTIEEKAIFAIEDAVAATDDVDVVTSLKRMERSIKNIVKLNNDDPSNLERKSIQKLKSSYLPSTIELIQKYQKSTTSEDTKNEIKGMFNTLAVAFRNIEQQLKEKVDLGTEVDIDVMRQTLEREGLLDSDFNIKIN